MQGSCGSDRVQAARCVRIHCSMSMLVMNSLARAKLHLYQTPHKTINVDESPGQTDIFKFWYFVISILGILSSPLLATAHLSVRFFRSSGDHRRIGPDKSCRALFLCSPLS